MLLPGDGLSAFLIPDVLAIRLLAALMARDQALLDDGALVADAETAYRVGDLRAALGLERSRDNRGLERAVERLRPHPSIERIAISDDRRRLSWRPRAELRPHGWLRPPFFRFDETLLRDCCCPIESFLEFVFQRLATVDFPKATLGAAVVAALLENPDATPRRRVIARVRSALMRLSSRKRVGVHAAVTIDEGAATPSLALRLETERSQWRPDQFEKAPATAECWVIRHGAVISRRAPAAFVRRGATARDGAAPPAPVRAATSELLAVTRATRDPSEHFQAIEDASAALEAAGETPGDARALLATAIGRFGFANVARATRALLDGGEDGRALARLLRERVAAPPEDQRARVAARLGEARRLAGAAEALPREVGPIDGWAINF